MKILIIHQYYLMPGKAGGSRFNEMSRMWAEQGHEVTVIAGTVDHTSGQAPDRYRGRWLLKEQDGPVTVWRCHVPESYRRSYAGRMWAFLAFTLSSATAVLRTERPDIIVATSPPLIVTVPGLMAAHLRGRAIPWIFEVRDLWPESAITTGVLSRQSPLSHLLYALERWGYRFADRINVLTPAFREDILKRGLAAADKIAFIPNGADLDNFRPGPLDNELRRQLGWGNRFVVLYAGAHGRANAVKQLVNAADWLRDRPDILIACVGDGPERKSLEEVVRHCGLENIVFLGPQPKDRMPLFVNGANAGVAVLQNNPTFRTVYPNKVFDYMACGRPTLLAIDGVARRLVCEEAKAGIFAEPENGLAIASAIRYLADNPVPCQQMGAHGHEWVMANASRRALAMRYLDLMAELVSAKLGGKTRECWRSKAQLHESCAANSRIGEDAFHTSDTPSRPAI